MNRKQRREQEYAEVRERFELAYGRIREIRNEQSAEEPFLSYFQKTADRILAAVRQRDLDLNACMARPLDELEKLNREMYDELLPERYEESYANPAYAVRTLGTEYGALLCFLYTELRGCAIYARESRMRELTIFMELFLEIYVQFEEPETLTPRSVRKTLYYFYYDYCDVLIPERIWEQYDPELDFCTEIVETADLEDLRYLYAYGEYISENELRTARFLNGLPQEEIDALAFTYTDGYREGFALAGIDLSRKQYVNLHYAVGQERIVRAAIAQFRKLGLEPVVYRPAVSRLNRKQTRRNGVTSVSPNRQYEYDHRQDEGLYLDRALMERKLEVTTAAYEACRELAAGYAGPAVIETFGETPFEPCRKAEAVTLTDKQQTLSVEEADRSGRIVNRYVNREEYSFTIIAYPTPEIGPQFEEIFRETVRVNTLDKKLYRRIQEVLIEELNRAESVRVLGRGENRTDMRVMLHELKDPAHETNFENCLADVNIPVGEVFTSPRLTGTEGRLNVSEVYLNGLKFVNLELTFRNGMIADYTCQNFESEEENRRFVRENLLLNRETLPIGEFAIGTNTTAYVMANRYQILYKLPILIVEKTGPHFAVGDTCYSHSEENRLYNPDGKEIVAKDNECSILRKTDESKAYFNCHTDITIPYREIGAILSVHADGTETALLRDGRFVLPGTEELNRPLEEL